MFDRYKDSLIRLLLWSLLISSLVATITNLAWAFSVVSPLGSKAAWFGAISFDGAVLVISFYARRFEAGSYARHLARAIVITNTVISIYANVYRAIEFQQTLTRINGAAWLSMPIVLGFALPLLTWALAEVLVLDETQRTTAFEKAQKKEARQVAQTVTAVSPPLSQTVMPTEAECDKMVLAAVAQSVTSHRKIAAMTGLHRGQVGRVIAKLSQDGAIEKDSRGRIVTGRHDSSVTKSKPLTQVN